MRSIRTTLRKMVEREVRLQLNVIFYGRKKGPSMAVGNIVRKADKKKLNVPVGNVFPIEERRKGAK